MYRTCVTTWGLGALRFFPRLCDGLELCYILLDPIHPPLTARGARLALTDAVNLHARKRLHNIEKDSH